MTTNDKLKLMTITNHLLAGSLIGIAIKQPAFALPIALLSHFVMDALPHFGYEGNKGYSEALKHRLSYYVGIVSFVTTAMVVAILCVNGAWLALLTGLVAIAPDGLGVYNYLNYEKHGNKADGFVELVHIKFHRAIQRYERPWGIFVELLVFLVLTTLLIREL